MASGSRPLGVPLPSGPTIVLCVVLGVFAGLLARQGQLTNFVSLGNIRQLLHQASVPAVIALGMLLVVISGGIDLSVGSIVALVTVSTMQAYEAVLARTDSMAMASLIAVAAGIGTGGACGLCNGLVITLLRVSPFVTTLGMLSVARGLALLRSNKIRLSFRGETPGWVEMLERSDPYPVLFDPGVWSVVLLAVLVAVLLRWSVLGRHCYAIGSSAATARLCGVPVERRKLLIYTLSGLLTGWGGVLLFAQTASGDPNGGQGLELNVIAAVVIGGASLSGGRGTVVGTLLGVFLLSILESVLIFLRVAFEWKFIVIGGVVILNTALTRWQSGGERGQ
jgi:ribose transport system permease protein